MKKATSKGYAERFNLHVRNCVKVVKGKGLLMIPMEHCHVMCCDRSNHAVRKKLHDLRLEQLLMYDFALINNP